jgi:class 3 adenylate cyclase
MIFSLQRRFLLLLLLPVAVILIIAGVGGFLYARAFLVDQWTVSTRLKLEKAAHQIQMQLEEKLELIRLIGRAEEIPDSDIVRTYLIQELLTGDGVRFVDLEPVDKKIQEAVKEGKPLKDYYGADGASEPYATEICGDMGFCAPILNPNAPDRTLTILKLIGLDTDSPKKLTVRVSFDSFLKPIKEMALWEGSTACLVTSTGQFLAHTEKSLSGRKKLGDNGNEVEKEVFREILDNKDFGTVFGRGHPPDVVAGFYKVPFVNWYMVLFSRGDVIMAPIVQFRHYYTLAGLVALGVILLLIRLITRSVGRSVAEISAAAARVEKGDYAVRLPEESADEIGLLNRSFNNMIAGLKQRDLIEQTFGRYVDKNVAEELMSKPEALRLGGEKRTVTIMMSDLRNFTAISEKLQPEEVIKMLNRYFARMIAVIECYRGIIVDFYGDSILVFFNGMESDIALNAWGAVRCALEMQQELEGFVKENIARGLPVVTMGIGIHTGEVIVGNIGTETRAKYGIVGSDVNLTDRIQSAAPGGKVVISEKTYDFVSDKVRISQQFSVCLKGVEENHTLYEVESVMRSWSCLPVSK